MGETKGKFFAEIKGTVLENSSMKNEQCSGKLYEEYVLIIAKKSMQII